MIPLEITLPMIVPSMPGSSEAMGVIVLAIRKHDGKMLFNPPADTLIVVGDCLIVMGQQEHLRRLEKLVTQSRRAR